MPKQLLLDGHSLLFRAYHALPALTNQKGLPTGAIHGFFSMVLRVVEERSPDRVIVVFDTPEVTFRHQQMETYKGNRAAAPDDFRQQVPFVQDLLRALGVPVLMNPGFEADDVLGTLAKRGEERGYQTEIVTGDRDLLQLVNSHIVVLLTTRAGISDMQLMDPEAVVQKMGVKPEQVPDLKALMGDASDNIPGIKGIGGKTACSLIATFEHIENLFAQLDTVEKPRWKNLLFGHEEEAALYKNLATIHIDVPVLWPDVDEPWKLLVSEEARQLIRDLELHAIQKRIFGKNQDANDTIREEKHLQQIPPVIEHHELPRDWDTTQVYGVGFDGPDGYWIYDAITNSLYRHVMALPPEISFFGWGIKALYRGLLREKSALPRFTEDGRIQAYLLNPEQSRYEIGLLAEKHGYQSPQTVSQEAVLTTLLIAQQAVDIEAKHLTRLYQEVELPLARVLALIENRGMVVDESQLEALGKELDTAIAAIQQEIYQSVGHEFNINSPQQLAEVLFDELNLPVLKKTKTGKSTDAETLETLAPLHPVADKILQYRQYMKLKGTYVDGLAPLIDENGRIHTTLHQTVTATGRLSSSDPNLQNIPVRLPMGRRIREVFLASPGQVLLAADYSQIELRLLAHLSEDENLIQAFRDEEDIHQRTASEIFGIPMDQVNAIWRSRAKAVNFGIVYGISDFGLARDTGVTRQEAKQYIARYFERYPRLKEYFEHIMAQARQDGYVTTMLGRRRSLPDIIASNRARRQYAERTAVNTVIQGSAADLIKVAMVAIEQEIQSARLGSQMVLQVHDELIWDVVPQELDEVVAIARSNMITAMDLNVPLIVEFKKGPTWNSMQALKG